jgi:F-type H+-transporting ATPase subunit epsilon
MSTLHLEIVLPDRAFYADEVQELVVKTPNGEIGILKGHIPMVVAISIGPVKIKKGDKWLHAFLSEGFMQVTADKTVVFADSAEWPEEIDVKRAKAAEERVRTKRVDRPYRLWLKIYLFYCCISFLVKTVKESPLLIRIRGNAYTSVVSVLKASSTIKALFSPNSFITEIASAS